jgi:serine/threonine protein kinase/Tfp pilus assembly protein PilF
MLDQGSKDSTCQEDAQATRQEWSRLATEPDSLPSNKERINLAVEEFRRCAAGDEEMDVVAFCERFPEVRNELCEVLTGLLFIDAHRGLLAGPPPEEKWPHAGDTYLGLRLERQIGQGGFGRVFQGTEPALGNRPVAVKVAYLGGAEASTLGRLEHRNVVPVYSIKEDPKTCLTAVCMPYLGSTTLQDVLDRVRPGELPGQAAVILDAIRARRDKETRRQGDKETEEAATGSVSLSPCLLVSLSSEEDPVLRKANYVRGIVHLGAQMADALAYVHARGIAHLDLKPTNVLLTAEGRPMLLDFNSALEKGAERLRLGGTVPYMSPEQLAIIDTALAERDKRRQTKVDDFYSSSLVACDASLVADASDVFSLGVMLYELLAGFHPFGAVPSLKGRALLDQVRQRQLQGARPLHLVNPQVSAGLALLVDRCLELDPADRPTARDLAVRLRRSQRGLRPLLARCGVPLLCALLLVVPSFIGGGVWLTRHASRAQASPAEVGKTAFAQGMYEVAKAHFKKALEKDPESAELLLWLARTETRLGDLIEAEAHYKKADTLSARGDIQASRAYNILLMGEDTKLGVSYPEQALQENRRALASGFESAALHNNLAWSAILRGHFEEAEKALQRAIELEPTFQGAYLSRVVLEFHQTNRDRQHLPLRGVADLRRALELGPVAAECYFYGAVLCVEVSARGNNRPGINCAEYTRLAQTFLRQAIEKGYRLAIIQQHPRLGALLASLPAPPKATITPDKAIRQKRFYDPLSRR